MLGSLEARRLCQKVLGYCGSNPAEVLLFYEDSALTRFANNTIHQNVSERNATVLVRFFQGKSMGTATTNRLDDRSLEMIVDRARTNAKASPEDPDFVGLPGPAVYADVHAFDESTATYTPQSRARSVSVICQRASEKKLNASGAFSSGVGEVAVANSEGVFAHFASTNADFQTVVMGEDASGRAHGSAWRVEELPVGELSLEAIRNADQGRNPRKIDPGEYPVVFEHYVTEDLLTMLNFYGMGALALMEGRSWMNDRLGQKAMSERVSIWDDGLDSKGSPMPFDYEGVPKQRVEIVKKGIVKGPVYDRYTARKMGAQTTGHALPPTMRGLGPIATNLFIAPGDASVEEMIRSTQKGIYINRFWYTRLVHPKDCVITGMTRDGVFMIEDGELAYPVKNLRFTQSYVQALADVEAVGRDTHLLMEEFGGIASCIPALKIARFNFTGSTV
jgi:predicted Zn-dependent protease